MPVYFNVCCLCLLYCSTAPSANLCNAPFRSHPGLVPSRFQEDLHLDDPHWLLEQASLEAFAHTSRVLCRTGAHSIRSRFAGIRPPKCSTTCPMPAFEALFMPTVPPSRPRSTLALDALANINTACVTGRLIRTSFLALLCVPQPQPCAYRCVYDYDRRHCCITEIAARACTSIGPLPPSDFPPLPLLPSPLEPLSSPFPHASASRYPEGRGPRAVVGGVLVVRLDVPVEAGPVAPRAPRFSARAS